MEAKGIQELHAEDGDRRVIRRHVAHRTPLLTQLLPCTLISLNSSHAVADRNLVLAQCCHAAAFCGCLPLR